MASSRSQMFQYASPNFDCIEVVEANPRKKTMTDETKTLTPWIGPASRGFLQYLARSGWLTSMGERLPKMTLIPDMIDQPRGVSICLATCDAWSIACKPPP